MTPPELTFGARIDLHVERDRERGLTIGTFRCPCGWWTRTSAKQLLVPGRVRDHARVCPHAHPEPDVDRRRARRCVVTAAETLRTGIPLGWAWGILDADAAVPVFYAYSEARPDLPALHFESTSAIDLVDQVHEALDAWQTDLEMRLRLNGARG